MKKSSAAIIFLSALLITCSLFAQTQGGAKPKSVLHPPTTTSFKEPSPEDMAKDNKVNLVDQYEKDCDAEKGERYDIGFILHANWYEKASYASSNPPPDGPTYTVWDYKCEYISRFITRVYLMPEPTHGSKIEVAMASFKIYPKNITGSYVLSDSHGRMASTSAKVGDALGAIAGDRPPEAVPLGAAAPAKGPLNDKVSFNLDMTLVGLVYPTYNGIPLVTITPFMATLEPDAALKISKMAPDPKLYMSPAFIEEYKRAFFKAPLKIENLSIARLKEGPITRTITDAKGGRGLIGKMPSTTGGMDCSFDITVTAYLKRIQDDGYVPSQPSPSEWYGPGDPPQGGEGSGGPGNVKPPKPPDKETPKGSSGKGKAPGLTGNPPETDRVKDVKAKARRMLDRALRDLNMNKNSSNFLGKDYTALNDSMQGKLIGLFIRAGQSEWVTISKSPQYYANKLAAFYNSHRNLEEQAFLDVLLTMIIMEYDWTEEGIDKEALAREYLGDSVYKANKFRSSRLM